MQSDFDVTSTISTDIDTDVEMGFNDEGILPSVISLAREKFHKDIKRLSAFVDGDDVAAIDFFGRTIYEIALYDPKNLIVSLTDSKSIHFKIYNDLEFESHLEVFYIKEDDEDTVEAVLTVFKNDQEVLTDFGDLDHVLSKYRKAIGKEAVSFIDAETDVISW